LAQVADKLGLTRALSLRLACLKQRRRGHDPVAGADRPSDRAHRATQKTLAAGVPVCTVPFGRDQLEVARRVEVSGAGTRLPASRLNPQRLRAKTLEAITQKPEAEKIASAFAAASGPQAASDNIEQRLLRRTTTNTPAIA
jgi:hypothetical protein